MVSRLRSRRLRRWFVVSVTVIGIVGAVLVTRAQAVEPGQPARLAVTKPGLGKPGQRVTLITGDQVTLRGGYPGRAVVQPGAGRKQLLFRSYRAGGRLYVIPSDVAAQVTAGRLDRRLFDATGLIAAGYGDRTNAALPLVVTYSRGARHVSLPGATVSRQLPTVNGVVLTVPRTMAGLFWKHLSTRRYAGIDKIRLDDNHFMSRPHPVAAKAESYTLTIHHIGIDGKPAAGQTTIYGITTDRNDTVGDPSGTVQVRLPKAEYLLDGTQAVRRPGTDKADFYAIVRPSLHLTRDTTLVFDARTTRNVKVSVPQPDAATALAAVGYSRSDNFGGFDVTSQIEDFGQLHTAQAGPSIPTAQLTGYVTSQWAKRSGDSFANSPYLYATVNTFPGSYPTGFTRQVHLSELAIVDQAANAASDRSASSAVFGTRKGLITPWAADVSYQLPARRRLLLDAGATWHTELYETVEQPGGEPPAEITKVATRPTTYRAGEIHQERLNAVVFTPTPPQAVRTPDSLSLSMNPDRGPDSPMAPVTDAGGNLVGTKVDSESSRLYRDGEQVAQSARFGEIQAGGQPAGKATYTFVTSLTRSTYATHSTRIDCTWTFTSAATGFSEPLLGVRYQPKVDSRNIAARTPKTVLPIAVVARPGADRPGLRKPELKVSGDGGKTWQAASVVPVGKGLYKAIFDTLAGSTVSLKATLTDVEGNTTEQTVVDAFRLK